MNRRHVLRTLGGGAALATAGCVGKVGSLVGLGGMAVIEDVSPASPPPLPVNPDVAVANRRASPDQPATLAVRWTSTSDRLLRLGDSKRALFHNQTGTQDAVYTADLNESRTELMTGFSGCWQFTSDRIGGPAVVYHVTLAPEQTHRGRVGLYSMSGCHAAGTYTVDTSVTIRDTENSSEKQTGDWEIDVELAVA